MLDLVKECGVDVWEIRKHKLYDGDSGSGVQLHIQSSPGERNGKFSQNGTFSQNGNLSQNGKSIKCVKCIYVGLNVSSFTHGCGCMVNGGDAMAAI